MPPAKSQLISKEKPLRLPWSQMPRVLFNRRWWATTILVVAGMIVLARLGVWQLDRLEQRRARNAAYLSQISAPPLQINGADHMEDPEALLDRQAVATGAYDFSQGLVLVQQNWQGRPGAHLVSPLVLDDGETAVLVNRGWIPSADVEAGALAQYDEPGELVIDGVIQLSQTLSDGRETVVEGPLQEWYRIDIAAIQSQMPYKLLPVYLLQSPSSDPQIELPYRIEPDIDLSDGPHLFYAIQWFLFASILGVGYVQYIRIHTKPDQTETESLVDS